MAAEVRSSSDQKKLIIAATLGVVALVALWWTFIGFGSSQKSPPRSPTQTNATQSASNRTNAQRPQEPPVIDPSTVTPVVFQSFTPDVPEPRRNIFAFYEPPVAPTPRPPTPTPTPTPPALLASLSPSNVYARTEDFTLEARGNLFTPEMKIFVDGRELSTRYLNAQQVTATVPASMIASPGSRAVVVRSADNKYYTFPVSFTVTAPPVPNYNFVGIIGKPHHIGDTAILQEKGTKEIISVQRGDPVAGRFKVTSIGDRELVLVDTSLKITHKLALTTEGDGRGAFPSSRPTPRVQSADDEPQNE